MPQNFDGIRNNRHRLLGYRVTDLAGGRSRLEWNPGPDLANPMGFVHGGFVAAVIDDTCGTAILSLLDELKAFPTVSMHIDFVKGVRIGGSYVSEGVVVRAGRQVTVADATITDPEGTLLARGTCIFALDLSGSPLVGFRALGTP